MSFFRIFQKPKIILPDLEMKEFIDSGLYQYPTKRAFCKLYDETLINENEVREFTNFDGEMRINKRVYKTFVENDFAYGSQPHLDVESSLATQVFSLNNDWDDEWGGHLYFYDYEDVSDEYKKIMQKLIIESPKKEDVDTWNQLKIKDTNFKYLYVYKMSSQNSILFKNGPLTWHGVDKTEKERTVLIVTYHDKNKKCEFGD